MIATMFGSDSWQSVVVTSQVRFVDGSTSSVPALVMRRWNGETRRWEYRPPTQAEEEEHLRDEAW